MTRQTLWRLSAETARAVLLSSHPGISSHGPGRFTLFWFAPRSKHRSDAAIAADGAGRWRCLAQRVSRAMLAHPKFTQSIAAPAAATLPDGYARSRLPTRGRRPPWTKGAGVAPSHDCGRAPVRQRPRATDPAPPARFGALAWERRAFEGLRPDRRLR